MAIHEYVALCDSYRGGILFNNEDDIMEGNDACIVLRPVDCGVYPRNYILLYLVMHWYFLEGAESIE